MSTAPAPLRATTVAGAILAVIFIALSAAVGGINVWRTHAAETFKIGRASWRERVLLLV